MTKTEIVNRIVENHNRIIRVSVSGEDAILIADTIRDMRDILAQLQRDISVENSKSSKNCNDISE